MNRPIPAVVLGGSGYVAGELVRLLAAHPGFALAAVVSESRPGEPVVAAFPHLAGTAGGLLFSAFGELPALFARAAASSDPRVALVSAAPHGASAALVVQALDQARAAGAVLSVVDLSADFRFPSADEYRTVYGHEAPSPELLGRFVRALPEHAPAAASLPPSGEGVLVAHPGCFTTAVLLAVVPLLARDLAQPRFSVAALTGSTGSGRSLSAKTHHPERRSNVSAYTPLAHRHAPEMEALAGLAAGRRPEIDFVPISGPQARGIYATVQGRLTDGNVRMSASELAAEVAAFYAGSPFVAVEVTPPALTDVVGTQRAHLGAACARGAFAVTVAIDNLVRGAAGGGVQWLNRIHGYDETTGLTAASLGWF